MINSESRVFIILFFVVVMTWFAADFFKKEDVSEIVVAAHSPDYFSSGYYKKDMDIDGSIKNELNAKTMTHYSDDGRTHLEQPVMILNTPGKPPWVIKSEKGILEADGDNLLLTGKVFISRKGTRRLKPFKINTSELKVKLSVSYAETKRWAEIVDVSNRTEGIGFQTTFSSPIKVKFLSRVKGRYDVN